MVITGMRKRVISGGGGFVVPLLERADYISLENIKVEVQVKDALSMLGVGITASGVAVIKVRNDRESILAAVEQFNTGNQQKTIENIKDTGSDVLEGKLREIVSKLTVEEIYRDREKFASKVQEVAAIDLAEMGLEMKVFTIRDISDRNGYLDALGAEKIAQVKKDANIAKAEAQMESDIKTAEAVRLGEAAKIESLTRIEECNKNKELKVQEYKKQSESAKANADLAYQIQENITQKEVIETAMAAKILEKQREKELVDEQMRIEILKSRRKSSWRKMKCSRRKRSWMPESRNRQRLTSSSPKSSPKRKSTGRSPRQRLPLLPSSWRQRQRQRLSGSRVLQRRRSSGQRVPQRSRSSRQRARQKPTS